ncbi:hypothetical protein HDV03_004952 [Kappamyces sp. JEL0829]|nr:hypothetical protein HDV03_004952 [Kappamyces sp. JEL0829]
MNVSNPISSSIEKITFSFYEAQDIKKLSVKAITNPQIFDTLNHPTSGGLYDAALGPYDKQTRCLTCDLDHRSCPGHFGHIDLAVPVYNSITFRRMFKLLQSTCHYCHKLRLSSVVVALYAAKFKLLRSGLLMEANAIDELIDVKPRKKPDDDDDHDDSDGETEVGGVDTILSKIEKFVESSLAKTPKSSSKKNTLTTDALRKLERQFLLSIPSDSCQNCRGQSPKYRPEGCTKIFQKPLAAKKSATMAARGLSIPKLFADAPDVNDLPESDTYITPLSVMALLEKMWSKEQIMMDLLHGADGRKTSPSMFFLYVVAVTPNKFRPLSKMNDKLFEHPQNIYLSEIIKSNIQIQDIQQMERYWVEANQLEEQKIIVAKKEEFLKRTVEAWIKLQDSVNFLIDSSKAPVGANGKLAPPGIRQLLEKKEGLFRKHMMGKRVNYAARSVISPDPYIETNEIGIPPVFAKKLTYPEPVTHHNVKLMMQCVVNGPDKWPGATHVQNEDGSLISLGVFDEAGRTAIANQLLTPSRENAHNSSHLFANTNKKVYRHLKNGDFLLMNRQPTLHKPSIMAHTARVLPGEKTIRMHYANCNTYNADFDGDEMNAHFPQNDIARAEAMLIARNDLQYLVPTDGGVLRGLIQDHVDAGVHMCSRDTFFTREKYIQLVYSGLREANVGNPLSNGNIEPQVEIGDNGRIEILAPTILKPVPLWTGKQVISTILSNLTPKHLAPINLISKSRIPAKMWGGVAPEEQSVFVMDGHLLTGILDKSQFGASSNGLVHAVYEVYGPRYAGRLLSMLGRLFTAYLQYRGFTCRMDDLLLTREGDAARRDLIDKASSMGHSVAVEFVGSTTKSGVALGLEGVLRDSEKMAGLDSAMKTKTNKITSEIISTCIPGKLYKPFPHNHMQVMTVSGAKGSSVNVSQISCLLGQQELEGKRVPTMVSGKTLPSFRSFDTSARSGGYITGRFLTGIKPQEYYFHCMAGREGLIDTAVKTSRSGYLQRCLIKHLEGLKVHYDHTVRDSDGSVLQFHYGEDSLDVCKQTTLSKFDFNALNYTSLVSRFNPDNMEGKLDDDSVRRYLKKHRKQGSTPEPLLNMFSPGKFVGATSEKFKDSLAKYIESNPSKLLKSKDNKVSSWSSDPIPEKYFAALMNLKYMHSLVEPGEAVGLLAAQSIGEPSTQMTLNTFHFAGFGAKNVTLGIPRLREIIMTASANIKTPLMRLPLRDGVADDRKNLLCEEISKLVLSQLMEGVSVTEKLTKKIDVRLHFWHQSEYLKQYNLTPRALGDIIEHRFIPQIEKAISRDLLNQSRKVLDQDAQIGVGKADARPRKAANDTSEGRQKSLIDDEASEDDIESDGEQDDGDATSSKKKTKQRQQSTYDEEASESDNSDEESDEVKDAEGRTREERITDDSKFVSGFKFDQKDGKWCDISFKFDADTKKILMAALCEMVCEKVVIHEVRGIQRCFPQPNENENDKSVNLGTEGCNLKGIWDYTEYVDIDKIYTNDISAILNTYGVEAARSAITQEIASVFGVYGIDVDARHLALIGDYMTYEGGYKPFNRMGMDSNPSPFTQMSYERTTHFLTTSTLAGDYDPIDSPSARIVLGQVVKANASKSPAKKAAASPRKAAASPVKKTASPKKATASPNKAAGVAKKTKPSAKLTSAAVEKHVAAETKETPKVKKEAAAKKSTPKTDAKTKAKEVLPSRSSARTASKVSKKASKESIAAKSIKKNPKAADKLAKAAPKAQEAAKKDESKAKPAKESRKDAKKDTSDKKDDKAVAKKDVKAAAKKDEGKVPEPKSTPAKAKKEAKKPTPAKGAAAKASGKAKSPVKVVGAGR